MGDKLLALSVAVFNPALGLGIYTVQQQEEAAKDAARRQEKAEEEARLTQEMQRQRDVAERERTEDILPPILGQSDVRPAGIEALVRPTGVQAGAQAGAGTPGVQTK